MGKEVLPEQLFKDRLKKLVDEIGSAEKLAKRTGMSSRIIGKYLSGDSLPGLDKLVALADAAEVNLQWLATGGGPMKGFVEKDLSRQDPRSREVRDNIAGYLDISYELTNEVRRTLDLVLGERKQDISADKLMTLLMTLIRFYSRNFLESPAYRLETMRQNIECLVELALPEKKREGKGSDTDPPNWF